VPCWCPPPRAHLGACDVPVDEFVEWVLVAQQCGHLTLTQLTGTLIHNIRLQRGGGGEQVGRPLDGARSGGSVSVCMGGQLHLTLLTGALIPGRSYTTSICRGRPQRQVLPTPWCWSRYTLTHNKMPAMCWGRGCIYQLACWLHTLQSSRCMVRWLS
jgi:hypothetical protein